VDFKDGRPLASRLRQILKALNLNEAKNQLGDFQDEVEDKLHRPAFILLDNVEAGLREYDTHFWGALRAMADDRHKIIGFCATSRYPAKKVIELSLQDDTSLFFSRVSDRRLGPLETKDALDLLNHYKGETDWTQEEQNWALERSGLYAAVLKSLCAARQRAAEKGADWRKIWEAEEAAQFSVLLEQTDE
jgi:hypothetical protein